MLKVRYTCETDFAKLNPAPVRLRRCHPNRRFVGFAPLEQFEANRKRWGVDKDGNRGEFAYDEPLEAPVLAALLATGKRLEALWPGMPPAMYGKVGHNNLKGAGCIRHPCQFGLLAWVPGDEQGEAPRPFVVLVQSDQTRDGHRFLFEGLPPAKAPNTWVVNVYSPAFKAHLDACSELKAARQAASVGREDALLARLRALRGAPFVRAEAA